MGLTQTKLHWSVLAQDWPRVHRRLGKHGGREAGTRNPYGDTPLHLACYDGAAPPDVVRALLDACPEAAGWDNGQGRQPLELARRNYRRRSPHRAEVLALLRWHLPGTGGAVPEGGGAPRDAFAAAPPP